MLILRCTDSATPVNGVCCTRGGTQPLHRVCAIYAPNGTPARTGSPQSSDEASCARSSTAGSVSKSDITSEPSSDMSEARKSTEFCILKNNVMIC